MLLPDFINSVFIRQYLLKCSHWSGNFNISEHWFAIFLNTLKVMFLMEIFFFSWKMVCNFGSVLSFYACVHSQSLQSCLTLCNPVDHGPLGSSVHGILQARILEWVAISFSSDKIWSEWSEWREVAQSCLTLRDPMDCSPPGSSVHGIFQARVLEWGAIVFSK